MRDISSNSHSRFVVVAIASVARLGMTAVTASRVVAGIVVVLIILVVRIGVATRVMTVAVVVVVVMTTWIPRHDEK